jgi:predicted  nucleic acid-binding Zn-ribbon protein
LPSLRQELKVAKKQLAEWDKELDQLHVRNGDLGLEVQMLQSELEVVRTDRPEIQKSVLAVAQFPEPGYILNQVRDRVEKSKITLLDVEVILTILKH